jgi:hypothetical protein
VVFAVFAVIPAKAGIQYFRAFLDSRLRGSDDRIAFFSNLSVFGILSLPCTVHLVPYAVFISSSDSLMESPMYLITSGWVIGKSSSSFLTSRVST